MGIPVYEQFPGGFPGGMTKGLRAATNAADTGGNAALWRPAPRQPLRRGEACPFGCGRNLRDRTPGSTTTGADYPSHRTNGPVGRRLNMQFARHVKHARRLNIQFARHANHGIGKTC